jgi:hypothetical protein
MLIAENALLQYRLVDLEVFRFATTCNSIIRHSHVTNHGLLSSLELAL